jgi:hypothetical protein
MYLHEFGVRETNFTKKEMQQGKHQEHEKKLHEQQLSIYNYISTSRASKPTPYRSNEYVIKVGSLQAVW